MAICSPPPRHEPTLVSRSPTASAPANVDINHVQLRDLVACPMERGVLWYVSGRSIVEQDIILSDTRERKLVSLTFTPVTLTALPIPSSSGKKLVLLAAGGQDAELCLSLFTYTPRRVRTLKHKASYGHRDSVSSMATDTTKVGSIDEATEKSEEDTPGHSDPIWQHASLLRGSINNNVMLYIPPVHHQEHTVDSSDNLSNISPRLVVSNNDCTVKFFDICLSKDGLRRSAMIELQSRQPPTRHQHLPGMAPYRDSYGSERSTKEGWGMRGHNSRVWRYESVGCLKLSVPVNHTSISPDGSTILSCGDASTIFVHRIMPRRYGRALEFEPLSKYEVPLPSLSSIPQSSGSYSADFSMFHPYAFIDGTWVYSVGQPGQGHYGAAPPACFSTAWSADGSKFAAASQDGVVRVWDVRSGDPLPYGKWETGQGRSELEAGSSDSGRRRVDDWHDHMGGAPPWGIRTLKFAKNASGREVLVFTEHTSFVHIIDADTFDRHDVLRVPYVQPHKPRLERRPIIRLGQYPPYVEPSPTDSTSYNFGHEPEEGARYGSTIEAGPSEASHDRENAPIDPSNLTRFVRRPARYRAPRRRLEQQPQANPLIATTSGGVHIGIGLNTDVVFGSEDDGDENEGSGEPSGSSSTDNGLQPPRVLGGGHVLTHSPEPLSYDLSSTSMQRSAHVAVIPEDDPAFSDPDSGLPPGWDPSWDDVLDVAILEMGGSDEFEREARRTAMHLLQTGRLRLHARREDEIDNDRMERDIAFHELEEARNRDRDRNGPSRSSVSRTVQGEEEGGGAVVIPSLQDPAAEERVRAVLAAHHINAVTSSSADASARRGTRDRRIELADADSSEFDCLLPEESVEGTPQASTSQPPLASPGVPVIPPSFSRIPTSADSQPSQDTHADDLDAPVIPVLPTHSASSPPSTPFPPPLDLIPRSPSIPPVSDHRPQTPSVSDSTESFALEHVWRNVSERRPTPIPTIVHADDEHETTDDQDQDHDHDDEEEAREQTQSSGVAVRGESSSESQTTQTETQTLPPCRELIESTARLDIAGVCFDPTGAFMYVATTDGITEWTVQGVERRWWGGGAYL